jgi:hypothetical protein
LPAPLNNDARQPPPSAKTAPIPLFFLKMLQMCPVFDHFPQKNVGYEKEKPLIAVFFQKNVSLQSRKMLELSGIYLGGKYGQRFHDSSFFRCFS